jgi:hypothetical protein
MFVGTKIVMNLYRIHMYIYIRLESYISNIEYTGQGKFGTLFVGVDST